MRATILLADAAQEAGGKLYILGAGWSVTGPRVPPCALVAKLDVPWDQADRSHHWRFDLLDEDGGPVLVGGTAEPIRVEGDFDVRRPEGLPPGTPIDVPVAINFGPLPLASGRRYVWQLSIDGEADPTWTRDFYVRS